MGVHVHLVQLALSTTGDLLSPELDELLLQLIALLLQLLLVLAPELRSLDLAGRLHRISVSMPFLAFMFVSLPAPASILHDCMGTSRCCMWVCVPS